MAQVIVQSPVINTLTAENTTINTLTAENTTVAVATNTTVTVATIIAEGPQGPAGMGIDEVAKVDKSVVYYDAPAQQFKADASWTISTLTDGGNF